MVGRKDRSPSLLARDWVALIIAIGTATGLNLIIVAVIVDAWSPQVVGSLSENATQIITGALGGSIGILGSYLGSRGWEQSGQEKGTDDETTSDDRPPPRSGSVSPG